MKHGNVSPYRWVILFSIAPIIISTEMMWLSLAPISSLAEGFYGVAGIWITLFTMSYMIMFVIFSIPASWVIDRYGYRFSLIIGAVLTAFFGMTRAFFADSFPLVMLSQFLIAIGQPFLLNISTKVPANWFPISERATAAGILTMAQYLGFALPMVIAPVKAATSGLPSVFMTFAFIASISAVISIVFSREKPAIPPPGPKAEKEDFSIDSMKKLFQNKAYLLALLVCFVSIGVFNTILTLIESILLPRGITSMEAGIIGAVFVIAGVVGAIILPILSDKLHIRVPFFVISITALVPLYLGLTLVSNFSFLLLIAGIAGFSIMGAAPILFQHGSEVAYPTQEGTSLGTILLMGQISGVAFVFLFEALSAGTHSILPPMLAIIAITAAEIPITLKMKESPLLTSQAPFWNEKKEKRCSIMPTYVISYDIGTTGIKTCLFEISNQIELVASATANYPILITGNGGAEQDPTHWWQAMCCTTAQIFEKTPIPKHAIEGVSFCAQMQSLVLVDQNGVPVRNAMSYMDSRAGNEMEMGIMRGVKVSGLNLYKLFRSLRITGAVSASVKDPVWKYNWVKNNEPELFSRVYKWLDVKDFLVFKTCHEFVMSEDSAFATLLYDTRKGTKGFNRELCKMMGVNMDHLPAICKSIDLVGTITEDAALELGLLPGTPVFAGGGDASLIGVGAGAVSEGDTHIYMGTSGWVSTVVRKQLLSLKSMTASIVGADPNSYHFFAELETAGKCLEWVRDHLALDEIDLFLEKKEICDDPECIHKSLYDYMMFCIKDVPPGSNGVIFTPWLHGNRCPFEDPNARGMFFNIGLETGKTEMIHAVLEGVCYHLKWQLESMEKCIQTSPAIRLVGGGALSPLTCQILSNVLNRHVEVVDSPQNVGAVGAAIVIAVGLGLIDNIESSKDLIPIAHRYSPNESNARIYNEYFPVFKSLYRNNAKAFKKLNQTNC